MKVPLSLFLIMIFGCGDEQSSPLTSVIETSDITLIAESKNTGYSAAVGNLMVLASDPENQDETFVLPYCSGFYISPTHILTAAHCVKDNIVFDTQQIAMDSHADRLSYHVFGDNLRLYYDGAKIPAASNATAQNTLTLIYQSQKYDFAIFKTNHNSESFIDITEHIETSSNLKNTLISHPHGVPKTIASKCSTDSEQDDGVFFHDCDSLSGSSGGLMLVDGKPYGMHIQTTQPNSGLLYSERKHFETVEELSSLSGCEKDCPDYLGFNIGLSLAMIKDELMKENKNLYLKLIPGKKS